jgi:hypothetical protein
MQTKRKKKDVHESTLTTAVCEDDNTRRRRLATRRASPQCTRNHAYCDNDCVQFCHIVRHTTTTTTTYTVVARRRRFRNCASQRLPRCNNRATTTATAATTVAVTAINAITINRTATNNRIDAAHVGNDDECAGTALLAARRIVVFCAAVGECDNGAVVGGRGDALAIDCVARFTLLRRLRLCWRLRRF